MRHIGKSMQILVANHPTKQLIHVRMAGGRAFDVINGLGIPVDSALEAYIRDEIYQRGEAS